MDAAEYSNIAALEGEHWYYSGKRRFVREWIQRARPPAKDDVLLDCGAGTGLFAEEMSALCRVLVFPVTWLVRKARALTGTPWPRPHGRTEDKLPPRWLNALLRATFVRMAQWPVPFPFGVSLVLVARRR